MSDFYVDYAGGLDTNTGGTGDPFKTIQKALDSSAGGDTIHLGDNADHVLAATIVWTSGWGGGTSHANELTIRSWANGGSNVLTFSNGETFVKATIDGDDAVADIFSPSSTPQYVNFLGIHMKDCTGICAGPRKYWNFVYCEFEGWGTFALNNSSWNGQWCRIFSCYFHDASSVGVRSTVGNIIHGCFFERISGSNVYATAISSITNCVFEVSSANIGIYVAGSWVSVMGCTLNGDATSHQSIRLNNAGSRGNAIVNTVMTNNDGVGNEAINMEYGTTSIFGYNRYYNNNDTYLRATIGFADFTAHDIVDDILDPLVSEPTQDLRIKSDDAAVDAGMPAFPGLALSRTTDMGAIMELPSGGGGPTESVHTFA